MTFDWQGAWAAVIHHPLFGIGITLGALNWCWRALRKLAGFSATGAGLHAAGDWRVAQLRPELRRNTARAPRS